MEAWKAEVEEAAHWKEQALRHCNRADRAEALLAAKGIHFTDGTPCWCDPIVEDYRDAQIDGSEAG